MLAWVSSSVLDSSLFSATLSVASFTPATYDRKLFRYSFRSEVAEEILTGNAFPGSHICVSSFPSQAFLARLRILFRSIFLTVLLDAAEVKVEAIVLFSDFGSVSWNNDMI